MSEPVKANTYTEPEGEPLGVEEPTLDQQLREIWKEVSKLEKRIEKLESN